MRFVHAMCVALLMLQVATQLLPALQETTLRLHPQSAAAPAVAQKTGGAKEKRESVWSSLLAALLMFTFLITRTMEHKFFPSSPLIRGLSTSFVRGLIRARRGKQR